MVDKLLLEKIPLTGIARVCEVSETWLQGYVNRKYEAIPQQVNVSAKKKGRLTIQGDEMWSFVGNKDKQWIWLAVDVDTREIVGVHIGDRPYPDRQHQNLKNFSRKNKAIALFWEKSTCKSKHSSIDNCPAHVDRLQRIQARSFHNYLSLRSGRILEGIANNFSSFNNEAKHFNGTISY